MKKMTWIITCSFAIVLTILMCVSIVPFFSGYGTYAVLSPSMAPEIPVGSLIFVNEKTDPIDLEEGDVIAFDIGGEADKVCSHRVESIDREGGLVQTKGDANEAPDQRLVTFDEIEGVVVAHVPLAGYVLVWTVGHKVLIALAALVLFFTGCAFAFASPAKQMESASEMPRTKETL